MENKQSPVYWLGVTDIYWGAKPPNAIATDHLYVNYIHPVTKECLEYQFVYGSLYKESEVKRHKLLFQVVRNKQTNICSTPSEEETPYVVTAIRDILDGSYLPADNNAIELLADEVNEKLYGMGFDSNHEFLSMEWRHGLVYYDKQTHQRSIYLNAKFHSTDEKGKPFSVITRLIPPSHFRVRTFLDNGILRGGLGRARFKDKCSHIYNRYLKPKRPFAVHERRE